MSLFARARNRDVGKRTGVWTQQAGGGRDELKVALTCEIAASEKQA